MADIRGLEQLTVMSGVTKDENGSFRAFLDVRAVGEGGVVLRGQLAPEEVRQMALNFLASAEAGEQDCMVMMMLTRDVGMSEENAAGFISAMRDERVRLSEEEEPVILEPGDEIVIKGDHIDVRRVEGLSPDDPGISIDMGEGDGVVFFTNPDAPDGTDGFILRRTEEATEEATEEEP